MPATYLLEIVTSTIDKLSEVGIEIKAIICDQGSSNCKLFSLLQITCDKPFLKEITIVYIGFLIHPPQEPKAQSHEI